MDRVREAKERWIVPVVVIFFVLIAMLVSFVRLQTEASAQNIDSMHYELKVRQDRIDQLKEENVSQRKRVTALKDDEQAIADFARDHLGMVKPGELVLKNNAGVTQ